MAYTHTSLAAESSCRQNRSAPDPRLDETEAEGTDGRPGRGDAVGGAGRVVAGEGLQFLE